MGVGGLRVDEVGLGGILPSIEMGKPFDKCAGSSIELDRDDVGADARERPCVSLRRWATRRRIGKNESCPNSLAGGIGWSIRDASAHVDVNLKQAAPGYAEIPPKFPEKK